VHLTGKGIIDQLSPRRHLWLLIFDASVWICAVLFAWLARLDFQPDNMRLPQALLVALSAAILFTFVAWFTRLHDGRAPLGSLEEIILLGSITLVVGILIYFVNLVPAISLVPRSVPMIATLCAILLMAWGRAMVRAIRDTSTPSPGASPGKPVVVIGAGDGGRQLIRSMVNDPRSQWCPVALLDDDPRKRYLRIDGVPVRGTSLDLAQVAKREGATTAVIAIPSATAPFIREISRRASGAGLVVKVLPGVNDLLDGRVGIRDVRDIHLPDLLGRRQIDTDVESVAGYLTGQRVLVTGAGGSIGSELCRQISRWSPSELIMLDRDESALHAVQLSIEHRALLDSPNMVLADIRDEARIREIFAERRPQVVFHAAALKHLPMLEQYPAEAVKTNIWGTLTVLEAARAVGVQRFVNISTDKAANPISVLGFSKRIAEGLTSFTTTTADGTYLSVRFGNVLGSRGSVLTAFAAQISAGGPVTVTHPDVTRFFMTVDEAVQLVIQAAAVGRDGEALVLDMGKSIRIDDVARHLIDAAGGDINIEYTGLRRGEKMHEDLFTVGEIDHRPIHPSLSHVRVPQVPASTARSINIVPTKTDPLIPTLRALCEGMSSILSHPSDAAADFEETGFTAVVTAPTSSVR